MHINEIWQQIPSCKHNNMFSHKYCADSSCVQHKQIHKNTALQLLPRSLTSRYELWKHLRFWPEEALRGEYRAETTKTCPWNNSMGQRIDTEHNKTNHILHSMLSVHRSNKSHFRIGVFHLRYRDLDIETPLADIHLADSITM